MRRGIVCAVVGGRLEVVVLLGERHGLGLLQFTLVLLHERGVNGDLGRRERGRGDELERVVAVAVQECVSICG